MFWQLALTNVEGIDFLILRVLSDIILMLLVEKPKIKNHSSIAVELHCDIAITNTFRHELFHLGDSIWSLEALEAIETLFVSRGAVELHQVLLLWNSRWFPRDLWLDNLLLWSLFLLLIILKNIVNILLDLTRLSSLVRLLIKLLIVHLKIAFNSEVGLDRRWLLSTDLWFRTSLGENAWTFLRLEVNYINGEQLLNHHEYLL